MSTTDLPHLRRVAAILCGIHDRTYWTEATLDQKRYWIRRAACAEQRIHPRGHPVRLD